MKNGWPEMTLGDVCLRITDGAHHSPKSVTDGLPMASVKDLHAYGIDLSTCRLISAEEFEKLVRQGCRPQLGDVLIAKDGASALDTVCEVKQALNVVMLSSVAILRPDATKILPTYLRYYLDAEPVRRYMKNAFTTGAAIPRVVLKDFKQAVIQVPPLISQSKIVSVLGPYDNVIENNLRRIKILEEMARTLYHEWFIKFRFPGHEKARMVDSPLGKIPEGWEIKTFGEVSLNFDRMRIPLSKLKRETMKGEYPYYGAARIFDYINDYIFDGDYLLVAEDGSVITPDRHPVLQYASGKFWANNHTHVIQGKEPVSTQFLYLMLSNFDISGYITGAAQPKINQTNLNRIPVLVASTSTLDLFNSIIKNFFQKMEILKRKNSTLRSTRDLLLPKLISGELDVSELDINIGEEAA